MEDYLRDWELEREARYEARARLLPVKATLPSPPEDLKSQFLDEARQRVRQLNTQLSVLCGSTQVSCDLTHKQLYSYARMLQFEEDHRIAERLMDRPVVEYVGKVTPPAQHKHKRKH